jgi:cytochrome c oxidase subunit II
MVARVRRRRITVLSVALVLTGCAGAPSALDPHSPQARHISGLWWLMFVLATTVYLIVGGLVVFTLLRRRRRPVSERMTSRLNLIGGILIPVVILGVVAVFTVRTTNSLVSSPGTVDVRVAGEQWWWRVTYPELGVTTANEIHVPVGESVTVTLTSDNVIHSFWLAQLAGKTDLIPGQVNHLTFTAEEAGTYRGQCAEFCGIEHARMAFVVVADEPSVFDRWVDAQRRIPPSPNEPLASRGQRVFVNGSCAGCHTVAGTSATGTLGPDLSHISSRIGLAAETLSNTPADMTRWLSSTQQVKPGALMPQIDLSADELRALVAYLETLQ